MIGNLFPPAVKAESGKPITSSQQLFQEIYGGHRSAAGVPVTDDSGMRVSAVFACVALRAGSAAHLPFGVFRKRPGGGQDELTDDKLVVLLNRPNPWQTRMEFMELVGIWRDLRGNFFALKNGGGQDGAPDELIPVHPSWVTMKLLPGGEPEYTLAPPTETGLPRRVVPRGQLLHVKGIPKNAWEGMSRLAAAREAVGMAIAAEQHGARVFKNGTRLSGVLQSKDAVPDEARTRIKASWDEAYAGADNAWKVAVLEAGLEWKETGMTAEDAQWIESRRFQVEEIARIFGVPLHMIGENSKTTSWGTGVEQLSIGYVTYTLVPELVRLEQRFNMEFLSVPADGRYCKWNVQGLLRGDAASRASALNIKRQNGIINADEWRELDDMNPIPDGSGQVYLRQSNTVPLGTPASAASGAGNPSPNPNNPPPDPSQGGANG